MGVVKILDNRLNAIDLFFIKLKMGLVSSESKKRLYELVMGLEKSTQCQKERFILLYSLNPNQKEKYNYTSLGRKEGCTGTAIKNSVSRMKNILVNLEDDKREIFLHIIKDDEILEKN